MTNDLDEAIGDAQQMARGWRNRTPPEAPASERKTVYVMEGCDCLDQGGTTYRYHIHAFTPKQFEGWYALQQEPKVVARFKA